MSPRPSCPSYAATIPTRRELLALAVSAPPVFKAAGLVMERLGTAWRCVRGVQHASARHAPWGTFRIPALLLAIETGAVAPPNRPLAPEPWDEADAGWAWRDLPRVLGAARLAAFLRHAGFGNAEVPEGGFEPDGPLAVSASELARMLGPLLAGELGLRAETVLAYREASLSEPHGDATLHAVTTGGALLPGDLGFLRAVWIAGHLERGGAPAATFAFHGISGRADAEDRAWRTLRAALDEAGLT